MLDLFSGLGGWSKTFSDGGCRVVTTDIDQRFGCTVTGDILHDDVVESIASLGPYDVITASPPCEGFSIAAIGKSWHRVGDKRWPKSPTAKLGVRLLDRTIEVIRHLSPTFWVIENPRGMMRKMPQLSPFHRRTVTFCQYGDGRMKPTDLWGVFPPGFPSRRPCSNGDPCHERAPRGAKTGTQGIKGAALRSLIPNDLANELLIRCKEGLDAR